MDRKEVEQIVRDILSQNQSLRPASPVSGKPVFANSSASRVTYGSSGKPVSSGAVKVTFGTAGKIFSNDGFPPVKQQSAGELKCPLLEGTVSECIGCAQCVVTRPEDVKAIMLAGASRISALHPEKGSYDSALASMIDHTLLKANATQEQIGALCEEAKKYNFATVCVNPGYVALAKDLLKGSGVGVTTVIGFPLGATTSTTKAIEARDAIAAGADEIDMVINVGALKSGNYQLALDDIKAVREVTRGHVLKVIIETALLTKEEKIKACELSKEAGADFVKTSTGFSTGGATVEDIKLMRETVGPSMGVKASGGVHNRDDVVALKAAGATRIGASASVAIVTGAKTESKGH